tara:strand:+ start:1040 stop:2026 length:987 start_codon:yes stop_codon:yes gene_type:complete
MAQWLAFDRSAQLGPDHGTYISDDGYNFKDIGAIGVGIITHNRPEFLKQILPTIPPYVKLFIVNTGEPYSDDVFDVKITSKEHAEELPNIVKQIIGKPTFKYELFQFDEKTCVGHGKNKALELMRDAGCKHLFTMEDDVYIKDPLVFLNYIDAAHKTGIWHFNFGFSQKENLDEHGDPKIRTEVTYPNFGSSIADSSIILTANLLGAFTYYHTNVLDNIGTHDPKFDHNHMDHVELTFRAIKAGLHPPFWWFADINNSWDMIGNLSNMGNDSLVRNEAEVQKYFKDACLYFKEKHGYIPMQIPQTSEDDMCARLRHLHKNYKRTYTDD